MASPSQSCSVCPCWGAAELASPCSALSGYAFFDGASAATVAFVQAFAGGALLTMLADTMMPEAFRYGGKQVGLVTTLGFAVAFFITQLESKESKRKGQ